MAPSDVDKPFEPLVGTWSGTSRIFDLNGRLIGQVLAMPRIYWRDEETLIYQENRPKLERGEAGDASNDESLFSLYPLALSGRSVQGGDHKVDVLGVQTTSHEFFFQITRRDGSGVHLNHHQLSEDSTSRNVLGSMIERDRSTRLVLRAEFRRLSHDVAEAERRDR